MQSDEGWGGDGEGGVVGERERVESGGGGGEGKKGDGAN